MPPVCLHAGHESCRQRYEGACINATRDGYTTYLLELPHAFALADLAWGVPIVPSWFESCTIGVKYLRNR